MITYFNYFLCKLFRSGDNANNDGDNDDDAAGEPDLLGLLLAPTKLPHEPQRWFIAVPSAWLSADFGAASGFEQVVLADTSVAALALSRRRPRARVALVVEPLAEVIGVTVDHFQYLALMALHSRLLALLDQIELDRAFFARSLANLATPTPVALFCLLNKVGGCVTRA